MNALIVDDEPIARARIRRLLARLDVELAGEAGDGEEALALARRQRPDVVLLDIDMPRLDGLAVADAIDAPVIFTTAHRQHALEAFEADAYDYLLKPIGEGRLRRALEKVRARGHASEPWRLVVTEGAVKRFVDARDVDAFFADEKYVAFEADGEERLVRESLDALATRLVGYGFLRAHRGALVRRDAVEAYDASDGGTLVLRSGARVPVSRRAGPIVRAALGLG